MKILILSSILVIFVSCNNVNFQRFNEEEDRIEGEKITNAYFDNLLLGDYERNVSLFSQGFFEHTSKEHYIHKCSFVENHLGEIVSRNLAKWETNVIEGAINKAEYIFVYDVVRENYTSTESFFLIKDFTTDSIKIHKYNIESQGLLIPEARLDL